MITASNVLNIKWYQYRGRTMHNIPKLDVVLNLRGRLKCKHSCIIKCHLFQYDSVAMWYTMKYFVFEVRDYVERKK